MTQVSFFVGIDPGLDGAIALFDPENNILHTIDMPTVSVQVAKKNKRAVDMHALSKLLKEHAKIIRKGVVEEVGSRPGESVVASFNFGFGTACCHMAFVAHDIPYITVTPARWKLAMKIGADKEGARLQASRLMPQYSGNWSLKKHDGRAEAALLAYWLAKQEGVKPADPIAGLM